MRVAKIAIQEGCRTQHPLSHSLDAVSQISFVFLLFLQDSPVIVYKSVHNEFQKSKISVQWKYCRGNSMLSAWAGGWAVHCTQ